MGKIEQSGLAVALPSGNFAFGIQLAKNKGTAGIYLKSDTASGSCDIIYLKSKTTDNPRYGAITQNWNDRFGKHSVREMAAIGARLLISDVPNFDESHPLRPPVRPLHGRMLTVEFKTSNGYLHIGCNASERDFDKLRSIFEALVHGVSLPN